MRLKNTQKDYHTYITLARAGIPELAGVVSSMTMTLGDEVPKAARDGSAYMAVISGD
jgi:hypothetical protein